MYTSQDTPSVSNKRVRLTLIIALIVIGSWSVLSEWADHDLVRREGFCFSRKMIECCLRLSCTFKSGFNNRSQHKWRHSTGRQEELNNKIFCVRMNLNHYSQSKLVHLHILFRQNKNKNMLHFIQTSVVMSQESITLKMPTCATFAFS